MNLKFVTYVVLLLPLLIPQSMALNTQCAWDLEKYFSELVLKKIDPTDKMALEEVLSQAFFNPKRRLNSAEKEWVKKYQLEEAVEKAREMGRERIAKQTRNQNFVRGSTGGAAALVSLVAANRFYVNIIKGEVYEDEINETYHLALEDNDQEDLRLLNDVLECNPKNNESLRRPHFESGAASYFGDAVLAKTDFLDLPPGLPKLEVTQSKAVYEIFELAILRGKQKSSLHLQLRELTGEINWAKEKSNRNYLDYSDYERSLKEKIARFPKDKSYYERRIKEAAEEFKANSEYSLKQIAALESAVKKIQNSHQTIRALDPKVRTYAQLKYLWKNFGLSVCTRWGHESATPIRLDYIDELYNFVRLLPPQLAIHLRSAKNIVLSSSNSNYLPIYIPEGTQYFQTFRSSIREVNVYFPSDYYDEATAVEIKRTLRMSLLNVLDSSMKLSRMAPWDERGHASFLEQAACYFDQECRLQQKMSDSLAYQFFLLLFGELTAPKTDKYLAHAIGQIRNRVFPNWIALEANLPKGGTKFGGPR